MIRIASILILSGLLAQTFSSQVFLAGFLLNQKYISSTLCEKRDEVRNDCHGKCHLKKEISKEQSNSENKNIPVKKGIEVLISFSTSLVNFNLNPSPSSTYLPGNFSATCTGYLKGVFHPPALKV